MSKLNGRLTELALIAERGPVTITYAETGFVKPNRWVSNVTIRDFLDKGLVERRENQAVITDKGRRVLADEKRKDRKELEVMKL